MVVNVDANWSPFSPKPVWLYENIDRKEAIELLRREEMRDGLYLVRGNALNDGYVLMVCNTRKAHTFRIHTVGWNFESHLSC